MKKEICTVFELEFEPPVSSRCDSKLRLSGRKAASSLFHGRSRADKTDQYFLGVKQPQSLLVYLSWSTAEKNRSIISGGHYLEEQLKFIHSEKATKFCEISTNYLTGST